MPGYSFEPSYQNTIFVPDTLIAGSHPLVTDTVTIASGLVLTRGALLGQKTSGLYAVVTAPATTTAGANTGNGTISAVTAGVQTQLGTYRVNMTSATAFNVVNPAGELVNTGTTGTAFSGGQVGFTVTVGGTAFVANDGFNLVVEETIGGGTLQWVLATATATDGSAIPSNWAILAEDTDTSATGTNAATSAPVYLAGEFDANALTLGAGLTAAGVKAALRQEGTSIFIKTGALSNAIV